jgi:hypothetical protein
MSREEEDFGFSLSFVDEDELRSLEKELAQKNTSLAQEATTYQDKYETLYKMIMILLKNLLKEPTKNYIHWPDRIKDVEEFIKKINTI